MCFTTIFKLKKYKRLLNYLILWVESRKSQQPVCEVLSTFKPNDIFSTESTVHLLSSITSESMLSIDLSKSTIKIIRILYSLVIELFSKEIVNLDRTI